MDGADPRAAAATRAGVDSGVHRRRPGRHQRRPAHGRPAGLFELDLPFAFVAALGTAWALWALRHLVAIGLAVCALRRARLASRPFPVEREQMLRTWLRCRHRMHTARLVLSDDVRGAGVLGLWTPLIGVSPAVVDRLTPEELDRIVIHEAAHVLRRDDRADCVQRAIVRSRRLASRRLVA